LFLEMPERFREYLIQTTLKNIPKYAKSNP